MTTFTWKLGASGDWNTPANWNTGTVPNSGTADVIINSASSAVTIAPAESFQVKTETLAAGTLLVASGGALVAGGLFVGGNSIASGGGSGTLNVAGTLLDTGLALAVWAGSTLAVTGALDVGAAVGLADGKVRIDAGHTLLGDGVIASAIVNNGALDATNNGVLASSTGGHLTIQGAVDGTGTTTIASGATLQINGTLGAGQTIAFAPGIPETLILGSPAATMPNTITGFGLGDQIEFSNGITVDGTTSVSGNTTSFGYHDANGTAGTYTFTNLSYVPGTAISYEYGRDFATDAQSYALTRFLNWTGATSTNFGTSTNWNTGTIVPGPYDFVEFAGAGGTISGPGTVFVLDFRNTGSWTLAAGTNLSDTQSVQLGQNSTGSTSLSVGHSATINSAGFIAVAGRAGNQSVLSITNGGVVRQIAAGVTYATAMTIGNAGASGTLAPADGMVLVSGAGSLLDLNANALAVAANGGIGALVIQQGGTVTAGSPNSSQLASVSVANSGGSGSILVTGSGSALNATGYFLDGRGGTGSLTIQNGAVVTVRDAPISGSGIGIGAGRSAGPTSTATYGGNGVATVTGGGVLNLDSTTSGITVGGNGVDGALTVNTGGTILTGASLIVGTATSVNGTIYGGTGAVNIGAGSTVRVTGQPQTTNYGVVVGSANANVGGATEFSSGVITLTGTGALLDTNMNGLAVGLYSHGSLIISSGATVDAGTSNSNVIAGLSVGRQAGGDVVLTGAGSQLNVTGGGYVGKASDGNLTVENQAVMRLVDDVTGNATFIFGGGGVNSVGQIYVGGVGSALVTHGGTIVSQGSIFVGDDGTSGNLTINDGGVVASASRIFVGQSTTIAAGTTIITTTGTTIAGAPTLEVGNGSVDIGPGGTLISTDTLLAGATGTSGVVLGSGAGATGNVSVHGQGALLSSGLNRLGVGSAGAGFLTISQGGTVKASSSAVGADAMYIGALTTAPGQLTVTDPGSVLTAHGELDVGLGGAGSLLIQNQATALTGADAADAAQGFDVGTGSGASGNVEVTGTHSLLTNTGRFIVGDAGVGALSIQSGGSVITSPGSSGVPAAIIALQASASSSSVNVVGTGARWQVGGALQVGGGGSGLLSVADGASVTVTTLDAGVVAGSAGVIVVSGANSDLTTSGTLSIGDVGSGELSVLNGASVGIGGNLFIGQVAGGSGNVDVEGGTLNVAGNLSVGAGGPGVLTVGPTANVSVGGAISGGAFGVLNQFAPIDPDSISGTTVSINFNGTQTYPGFVDSSTFNIAQGFSFVLATPSITATSFNFDHGNVATTLELDSGLVDLNSAITFGGSNEVLVLGVDSVTPILSGGTGASVPNPNLGVPLIGGFAAIIGGYVISDIIEVVVTQAATVVLDAADAAINVVAASDPSDVLGVLSFATGRMATSAFTNHAVQLECFLAGTLIETRAGLRAVEELRAGDAVRTLLGGGCMPVVWVGYRTVDCARHPRPERVWPVRVAAGAFGAGQPARALYLSPDHAVYVEDVLIPVRYLLNSTTIRQEARESVTYYHVELDCHEVIVAEGLAVESYLDTGTRAAFANGGGVTMLHADFAPPGDVWELAGCAPMVVTGPVLAAVRERMAGSAMVGDAAEREMRQSAIMGG